VTVGERIHSRRKALRLTMKDIFNTEGIQTGNLSELEHDKYQPSVQTLISLSRALDCSVDWILTGEEHKVESLKSETELTCDGIPLSDSEMDLVAMYRLLDKRDKEDTFDYVTMKYEKATGKKGSVYSTYSDTKEPQDGVAQDIHNSGNGIA
jgi:HTH-type transcriptional regulator, cell division transcriptional repressor